DYHLRAGCGRLRSRFTLTAPSPKSALARYTGTGIRVTRRSEKIMAQSLPPRSAVPQEQTWNAESVYESPAAWETERQALEHDLTSLSQYPGTLSSGPAALADWLDTAEQLGRRMEKLYFYAAMSQAVETTNTKATAM